MFKVVISTITLILSESYAKNGNKYVCFDIIVLLKNK